MPDAEVVEWQTRSVQDAVSASSWRFKSSPRHKKDWICLLLIERDRYTFKFELVLRYKSCVILRCRDQGS